MNLKDWLSANNKTLEWLADEIGVSVGSASRVVRGMQNIPLSVVAVIEDVTGHEVKASDLVDSYRAAQPSEAAA